jgi:hypothetical protein
MESKALTLELKAAGDDDGAFVATFSTLNVVDHHGDVTVPGAFTNGQTVLIGAYQHDMMALPVGKGVIQSDDSRAWVEGSFFLDTTSGLDTYRTVKNAGGALEWSYVFQVLDAEDGEYDMAGKAIPVRYLKAIDVWSVDPVLRGAGINTRTDEIKSTLPFAEEAERARAAVSSLLARSRSLADLRAKEGRVLSAANVERLTGIAESLRESAQALDGLLQTATGEKAATPETSSDLQQLYEKYQATLALAGGVLLPSN